MPFDDEFFIDPDDVGGLPVPAEEIPWAGEGQAIEYLKIELEAGLPWYPAVLRAIGRWDLPEETYDGRSFVYLIGGEAFDWISLVERFYEELPYLFPPDEIVKLLFFGEPPGGFNEAEFRDAVGQAKYRTYLNYYYGIVVEEALTRAVEESITKERMLGVLQADRRLVEDVAERIYGMRHTTLLQMFWQELGETPEELVPLTRWKAFTYWLFKYRVRQSHKVKVAADTKRGIDTLERLRREALSGFRPAPAPLAAPIDLSPWAFRVVD